MCTYILFIIIIIINEYTKGKKIAVRGRFWWLGINMNIYEYIFTQSTYFWKSFRYEDSCKHRGWTGQHKNTWFRYILVINLSLSNLRWECFIVSIKCLIHVHVRIHVCKCTCTDVWIPFIWFDDKTNESPSFLNHIFGGYKLITASQFAWSQE